MKLDFRRPMMALEGVIVNGKAQEAKTPVGKQ